MSADDPFDVEELLEAPYKKQDNGGERSESGSDQEHSRSRSHKKKHRRRHSDDESPDRDRKKRHGDRDREHRRSRSRERYESSRSHRRSDRDRDDDRDRRRDRDDDRYRSRPHRSDRHEEERPRDSEKDEKRERARKRRELLRDAEKMTPEERDIRTVFCMQLAKAIREEDLVEFFSPAGTVVDVRLISDRNSRRSKGIAYVEFLTPDSLPKAISMTGQRVRGVPIIVQATQSEKNRLAAAAQTLQKPPGVTRLCVSNLHHNINDEMLTAVFQPFGQIETCKVQKNDRGESKGFAYVTFKSSDSSKQAIDHLQGFELVGRPVKVSFGDEESSMESAGSVDVSRAAMMARLAANPAAVMMPAVPVSSSLPGLMGNQLGAAAGLGGLGMAGVGGLGNLGGIGLPTAGLTAAMPTPVTSVAAPSAPSPCFNLQNMFDPANETEDGWQQEIMDDVLEEATKFGDVVHIHVDDKSPQGLVYVKCRDGQVASNAMKSLHGRFFAGKQIIATPIPEFQYHSLFSAAVGAFTPIKPSR